MDRVIVYSGAIPFETDVLNTNRNILIAMGLLAQDIFGTSTVVGGLPCTPTAPASLNVLVGPGRIYSQEVVDTAAYSSLAADTTDQIVKQGINLGSTELACAAPTSAGYSINYLIEGTYEDQDTNLEVLPYYNAANPQAPFSGPGNNGAEQATARQGIVQLQAKAGIPAPTGSQATPSADAGYIGLYIVTVAFGQTTITGANIQVAPNAPFIATLLLTEAVADGRYLQKTGGTLTGALAGTNASFSSIIVNGVSVQSAASLTSGSIAASLIPLSAVTQYEGSLVISFGQITGQIASAQVPAGAVTQFQASLSIAWGQISGIKNADELQGLVVAGAGNATPNAITRYDGSGYLYGAYINQSSANSENPGIGQVIVTNGTDNFFRKASLTSLESQMQLSGMGGFVNAASQLSGVVPNTNLPLLSGMGGFVNVVSQLNGVVPNTNLPRVGSMPGITIQADPGTAPSGSPGQVFEYY